MLMRDKTSLITGAAGAIGSAIARRFAEEGSKLHLADIHPERLEEVGCDLRHNGADVTTHQMDVTDEASVRRVFESIHHLDCLVNNAGYTRGGAIATTTLEEWNAMLDVNLTSVFLCTQQAWSLLTQSAAPSIINLASVNASLANPGLSAYASAKNGILAFTRQTAIEGAAYRIRANCLSPGLTISESRQKQRKASVRLSIDTDCYPLGRLGTPEDVANAALFLASDLSAFVNGIELKVDGGMSIQAVSALLRPDLRRKWKSGIYTLIEEEEA